MTQTEVMNCAAILASGIMANQAKSNVYDADRAVDLMMQIAEELDRRIGEPEREYRQL